MKTKNNPWMPLYIGDYLKDTSDLTQAEHGAYLRLIMFYWNNSGPIPDDLPKIFRATGAITPEEQNNACSMLQAFFKHHDGAYHHKRIDAELARCLAGAQKRKDKAFRASKARWDATSNAPSNATSIPPSNATSNAWAMPYQNQNQNQNHISDTKVINKDNGEQKNETAVKRRAKSKTEFPHGERCPDEWADWAIRETSLSPAEIARQYATARDWALAKGERKADWMAFWRGWCRRSELPRNSNSNGQNLTGGAAVYARVMASRKDVERN